MLREWNNSFGKDWGHLVLGEHEGLGPCGGAGKEGDVVWPLVLDAQSVGRDGEEAVQGWGGGRAPGRDETTLR